MPSIGIPLWRSAAGLARPTTLISTAVVAAIEYAGALPAIAMITESNPLSAPWRRPRSLLDIHISWEWGRTSHGLGTVQDKAVLSLWNGRSCASATGAETTPPPVTLTPAARAGSRCTAVSQPESAIAAT